MKRFKNKYLITAAVFAIYFLFLDDGDVFTIISKQRKLSSLQKERIELHEKYLGAKQTLLELDDINSLEKYAREKKLFKKDDEDLYVITTEEKIN